MQIDSIKSSRFYKLKSQNEQIKSGIKTNRHYIDRSDALRKELHAASSLNKISFGASGLKKNEITMSMPELFRRTNDEYFTKYNLLSSDSPEYKNLAKEDKIALKHLVRAADVLDTVFLIQDNKDNLKFRNYLIERASQNDLKAQKALILFNAQKGINAPDNLANISSLNENYPSTPGKGFYPSDLSKEEFHNILIKMLKSGEKEEVKKILSQRTMVERDADKLKATDYTDYFKPLFTKIADELNAAARISTNNDFNEFLKLQALALRENIPTMDAFADKKWATLQDTPLEFTITRECYDDMMTGTVYENQELKELLEKSGITPYPKDSLGGRVGIVNKEGTDYLLKIKKYLPSMSEHMPFKDKYEQKIERDKKQTMVDVDIVCATGHNGAVRAGISIAENLPNADKDSLKIGGGHRNVYHRQIRHSKYSDGIEEKLNAVLDPSQHKYFDPEASHNFTILHENIHSLGPKSGLEALGKYKNIIEENKADMGAIAMLDLLKEKGYFSEDDDKKLITTMFVNYLPKSKPSLSQAHRVRNVMQMNYMIEHDAIKVLDDGKLKIDFENTKKAANSMLEDIIKIQLDKNMEEAQQFVKRYFYWSADLEKAATNLRNTDKKLNGTLVSPLADELKNLI